MRIFILLLFGTCFIYGQSYVNPPGRPSFKLSESAKRKLLAKALSLKGGDSFQTVTNALGAPSFDSMSGSGTRKPGGFLRYDAVIWRTNALHFGTDEFICVYLNESNRLTWMDISYKLR